MADRNFALNFTFLHWFGINWHALNQSECRNCCLYIINFITSHVTTTTTMRFICMAIKERLTALQKHFNNTKYSRSNNNINLLIINCLAFLNRMIRIVLTACYAVVFFSNTPLMRWVWDTLQIKESLGISVMTAFSFQINVNFTFCISET